MRKQRRVFHSKFLSTDKGDAQWHSSRFARLFHTLRLAMDTEDEVACEAALPAVTKATSSVLSHALTEAKVTCLQSWHCVCPDALPTAL